MFPFALSRPDAQRPADYSDTMLAAGKNGVVWTRAALDAFIAELEAVVPGTTMAPPPGLNDPAMRADVLDYLEQAGKQGQP